MGEKVLVLCVLEYSFFKWDLQCYSHLVQVGVPLCKQLLHMLVCCTSAAQHKDLSMTFSERTEWHLIQNKVLLLAVTGSCLRI